MNIKQFKYDLWMRVFSESVKTQNVVRGILAANYEIDSLPDAEIAETKALLDIEDE